MLWEMSSYHSISPERDCLQHQWILAAMTNNYPNKLKHIDACLDVTLINISLHLKCQMSRYEYQSVPQCALLYKTAQN